MNMAFSPSALIAFTLSQGNSPVASWCAARGAILSRARARTLSIRMRSSSGKAGVESSLSNTRMRLVGNALAAVEIDGLAREERDVLAEYGRHQACHLV